jgi:hypothetical protein
VYPESPKIKKPISAGGVTVSCSEPFFLRYEGKIPAMAGCAKCQRKFFTPAIYSGDADGAQEYLFSKFDRHECEERPKKSRYAW